MVEIEGGEDEMVENHEGGEDQMSDDEADEE